ncbi:MAG: proton-conducting transporter membrane subunit [Anaerolineaceae bacterium]|nr:proton-conducting transporter membrane subunit [Anaerolineaceae bacterium]
MINLVLIFIFVPLAVGFILLLLSAQRRLSWALSCLVLAALAAAAFILPQDLVFEFRKNQYEIRTGLVLLGRSFVLPSSFLTFCGLTYITGFLWSLCSPLFKIKANFPAMSLIIPAMLVMMVTVEPFLYAAVIFEMVALLSIPLLLQKETRTLRGLLHFIVLQTIAMTLVLLSSWMLAGVSTVQSSNPMILRGTAMVLFGFVLWMPAFPFHVWIAELFKENHPWPVSFLLTGMQTVFPLLLLVFLDRFAWLRNLPGLFESFRLLGSIIIALAGLFASFQINYRRQSAYLFLNETGYTLLIIGLAPGAGFNTLGLIFLPRIISFWFWSFCLAILETRYPGASPDLSKLNGFILNEPLLSLGMVLAQINLMGMPLLSLFPAKRHIWFSLPMANPADLLPIALGTLGMMLFILRMIMAMVSSKDPVKDMPLIEQELPHQRLTLAALLLGMLMILIFGFFPHLFLNRFLEIVDPFAHLAGALSQ